MGNCGPVRPSRTSKWRAATLIGVHLLIAAHIAHWWVAGGTLTPVEPSEAMQTLETGLVNAGFVFFLAAIVLTLVFGRFVCGWACHIVAVQDLCAALLKRARLKPKPVRVRLLSLVPLSLALYMFVWPSVERIWQGRPAPEPQAHFMTEQFWATFPGPWMSVATFVVVGFLVVWWLGAKGFCTYGCPYGGFFAVADRFAPGRILVNENCDGCAHCTAVCTSNVRVHEEVKAFKMVVDAGCMKCLDCVSVCPKQALRFGFGKPALTSSPRRVWDFSWGEELAMAVVGLGAFFALRGLYLGEVVPMLLAVGLSVLAATAACMLWRLLRRDVYTWQHMLLKKDRRLTSTGRAVASLAALFLLFVAHSAYVHKNFRDGSHAFGLAPRVVGAEQDELCARATAAMQTVARWGFVTDPRVEYALGMLAARSGDDAATERHLREFLARETRRHPLRNEASLTLGTAIAKQGRLGEAEQVLVELLQREPEFAPAKTRLDQVREMLRRR